VWSEERRPRLVRLVDDRSWAPWLAALAAFALVAWLGPAARIGEGITRTEFLLRHVLWTACALGVVLPAMLGDPRLGAVRRLLSFRVLLFLGLVSYGIFLTHFPLLSQLADWGLDAWTVLALAGSALAIAFGALSYYAVERPALSLKRLVQQYPGEPPGEATAETAPIAPRAGAPG
jgi:peptidoglycan/LPS O-acetylase OafA/YrhL